MKKYLTATAIPIFLLFSCVLGCGAETEAFPDAADDAQTEELVLFDKNANRHSFDDRIAQEIMKRTGVTIRVIDSTDDASKKEELMFSYQDYPDIIKVGLHAIDK